MGSEILSPVIFAKGYDFFMIHAVGLTPSKFCALYSKSLINLEGPYLSRSAELAISLAAARFGEYLKVGSTGALITGKVLQREGSSVLARVTLFRLKAGRKVSDMASLPSCLQRCSGIE